ncbi:flagellar rod assembly protein FlgJ [Haematobacter missouriensis]|uniref:Flagellar biosynthesis protein FlgJ n=2 Tax=Haematobacter missouriensis TaxID=366616 RepID=A0A212AUE5_9RHOB|nr:rod-binding protein [Haematobacter missouriensis]KFI33420.1 flagellar rod assembly protein FlgJ [Haematobacter missouriensis]OWJ85099.1 flagellar biosynthesis protein FlgJ [Haematobacter missouriensis]
MEVDGIPDQSRILKLRAAAAALEGAFLAEMLKSAEVKSDLGGGAGEAQFASFLREAQAKQLVCAGGVGLSESLFTALINSESSHV